MVGAGRPARIRLFLEGIEVPVISAQISSQPNAPAQCVLQLPPAELGTRLLPRTLVHLFFLDSLEEVAKLVSYRGSDTTYQKEQGPTLYEIAKERGASGAESEEDLERDERNSRYKLLFCGEVMGFQWAKSPMSRSLVLQCLDLSNYWDYAYQFNNTDIFGPSLKAVLSGGATNLFTDFLSSPGEIATGLLHLPSANYPALKGLMGGIIRLVESIGGCYQQGTKFHGQNIFFSIAELRLGISRMITAYPGDKTVQRLLGGGNYDSLFGRSLGNLGEQVSIRTVLNAVANMVYHEAFSIPSPAYVPSTSLDPKGGNRKKLSSIPAYRQYFLLANQGVDFTKELVQILQESEPASTQANARLSRTQLVKRITGFVNKVARTRQLSRQEPQLNTGPNKKLGATLDQIRIHLQRTSALVNRRWFPGMPQSRQRNEIVVEVNKAAVLFGVLVRLTLDVSDPKTRTPSRLNTHIVRPDVWFAPPPRCNVVFPHHTLSMNYTRNWMQEPTRLLLKVHDEFFGEDELFDSFFFAPRAQTIKGKRHKGTLQELFQGEIMSHELYTGILPIFTKMGEFNIFALRGVEEFQKKVKPKVSLAQRSANYLYFKQRFASRNMTLQLIFSPWLVTGFPGVVLDRYVDPESAEEYLRKLEAKGLERGQATRLLGTHFLGNFAQIQHSLSPTQAETTVQIQFPREFEESTEFLGPSIAADQVVVKRFGSDAIRTYTVAALEKPKVGSIGIYYGAVQRVSEVTPSNPGEFFPVYTGPRRVGDPTQDGQSNIGVPVRLGDVSPTLASTQGVNKVVTFKAYEIREAIPRYRREIVDMPAEEIVRPGWYDDVWHPKNVSQVYQHYFRVDAITGKTVIGEVGSADPGTETLPRDELARQALGLPIDKPGGPAIQGAAVDGQESGGASTRIPSILTLDEDSSIEQAVRFILLTYSYIVNGNLSAQKFSDAYCWRPIASLPDVFGTSDLRLDVRGIDVEQGVEGFHSRAFGPYDDLFGLVTPEVTEVLGAKKSDQARKEGDIRGVKHRAVLDYVEAVKQVIGTRKDQV
jgi:hypothetical protein